MVDWGGVEIHHPVTQPRVASQAYEQQPRQIVLRPAGLFYPRAALPGNCTYIFLSRNVIQPGDFLPGIYGAKAKIRRLAYGYQG